MQANGESKYKLVCTERTSTWSLLMTGTLAAMEALKARLEGYNYPGKLTVLPIEQVVVTDGI